MNLTRKLLPIFLIFLLFSSLGCILTNIPDKSEEHVECPSGTLKCVNPNFNINGFLGENWRNYTLKRIYLAQAPDGGFTEIVDYAIPDIFSTYYFTKALTLVNQVPYNRVQTIKWLHEEEKTFFRNSTKTNIDDFEKLYFGVMSLRFLNETPYNKDDIINLILSYKQKNGSFVYDGKDVTWNAMKMLEVLGYNVTNLHDTRICILDQWNSLSFPATNDSKALIEYLSKFNLYSKMLEMLGVDYKALKNYEQKVYPLVWVSHNISLILGSNSPLFVIAEITEALKREGLLNEDTKEIIYKNVKRRELENGGFNLFGLDYGEPQGTYYAVKTLVLIGKIPDDSTIQFIHERETPLGGFVFCYQSFGDPILTYMAIYVTKQLGGDLNETKVKKFLDQAVYDRKPYSNDDPGPLYFVYMAYKKLGIQPDQKRSEYIRNETAQLFNLYLAEKTDNIVDDGSWISLIKLGKEIGVVLDNKTKKYLIDKILSQRNSDGTFGRHSRNMYKKLLYTSHAVLLLRELEYKYHDNKTIEFLLNSQTNGGWGTPDLYTTYYVVMALRAMEVCPRNVDGLLKLLKRVQYQYGGFNFYEGQKNAYGGLYETYLALRILELISSL